MCGIFGVWNRDGQPVDLVKMQSAVSDLYHRGPDDEGYLMVNSGTAKIQPYAGRDTIPNLNLPFLETALGQPYDLALGFRRLSILDLSRTGHQPMANQDGSRWIVFNGEIYNYIEVREELINLGCTFHSNSDTEVILAAYDHWGPECLNHFNGMWAFAIWDVRQKTLFCARDRFGIKPFYYICQGSTFAFASEIKALLKFTSARANLSLLVDYLVIGALDYDPAETLFDAVYSLPAGHWMLVGLDNHPPVSRPYWNLEQYLGQASSPLSDEKASNQLLELLESSIALRLRSDVPVGSSLSGGLDSSSIVCLVNQRLRQANGGSNSIQHVVSAIYENPIVDERSWIKTVVDQTGVQAHYVFPSADGLAADLEGMIWNHDLPTGGSSSFAQWCVCREAQNQGLTVMLDGQGSDEIFGGYESSVAFYAAGLLEKGYIIPALRELRGWQQRNEFSLKHTMVQTLQKTRIWNKINGFRRNHLINKKFPDYLHPNLRNVSLPKTTTYLVNNLPPGKNHLSAALLRLMAVTSLPAILRRLDRNSMAFSVETRVPYLDYRLVEFAFQLSEHEKVQKGWTKYILRNSVEGIVPDAIRWRRDKKGFPTPEAEWYHDPAVFNIFKEILFSDSSRKRGWLDLDVVKESMTAFEQGKPSLSPGLLWRWVDCELWARIFSVS